MSAFVKSCPGCKKPLDPAVKKKRKDGQDYSIYCNEECVTKMSRRAGRALRGQEDERILIMDTWIGNVLDKRQSPYLKNLSAWLPKHQRCYPILPTPPPIIVGPSSNGIDRASSASSSSAQHPSIDSPVPTRLSEDKRHPNPNQSSTVSSTSASTTSAAIDRSYALTSSVPSFWHGQLLDMPGCRFPTSFKSVSGPAYLLQRDLPAKIYVVGRISSKVVYDYLTKVRKKGGKDLIVFRLTEPPSNDDRQQWDGLLANMVQIRKFCVIENKTLPMIKDFYILPLLANEEPNEALLPFHDGQGLEMPRKDTILGLVVRHRETAGSPTVTTPTSSRAHEDPRLRGSAAAAIASTTAQRQSRLQHVTPSIPVLSIPPPGLVIVAPRPPPVQPVPPPRMMQPAPFVVPPYGPYRFSVPPPQLPPDFASRPPPPFMPGFGPPPPIPMPVWAPPPGGYVMPPYQQQAPSSLAPPSTIIGLKRPAWAAGSDQDPEPSTAKKRKAVNKSYNGGEKKRVHWANEDELVRVQYFELEEDERPRLLMGVNKNGLASLDKKFEREAMEAARSEGKGDSETYCTWKLTPCDNAIGNVQEAAPPRIIPLDDIAVPEPEPEPFPLGPIISGGVSAFGERQQRGGFEMGRPMVPVMQPQIQNPGGPPMVNSQMSNPQAFAIGNQQQAHGGGGGSYGGLHGRGDGWRGNNSRFQGVCPYFLSGRCTWGDRCRWRHDEPGAGGYSSTPPSQSNNRDDHLGRVDRERGDRDDPRGCGSNNGGDMTELRLGAEYHQRLPTYPRFGDSPTTNGTGTGDSASGGSTIDLDESSDSIILIPDTPASP